MQDKPEPAVLIAAVAEFLRRDVMPKLNDQTAFHVRVSANALDLVVRQLEQEADGTATERARLIALLGNTVAPDASLEALNHALCAAIHNDTLNAQSPGLSKHLWATTRAKVAVDQPTYASYKNSKD